MNKLYSLFVAVAFLASSCSDDNSSPSLKGSWKMTQSCGGFAGCTNVPANDAPTLRIDSKTFTYTLQGRTISTLTYEITSKTKQDEIETYEIKLQNGDTIDVTVSDMGLSIGYNHGGPPVSDIYKRVVGFF